ncbi:MAG TPA: isoprenylcysteine carboxylmethyltransferase family protein [Syntrophales bacterium]|nr:isoprenylcysteine carboxylmethyltransferase family protein [Syntrophales bacterium]
MKTVVDFIYRVVTGARPIRIIFMPIFAAFFLCILLLTIFLALKLDDYFNLSGPLGYPLNYILSVPLVAIGAFLWIWSVLHFAKAKGTPVPISPPPKLVDTGPYAYARNPMLSGVFLMLFGIGFMAGSPSLVFVFTPIFVVVSVLEFKFIEEPELEKRLGDPYREYKRKTPMLIPKVFR